jgi:hypothetical protein
VFTILCIPDNTRELFAVLRPQQLERHPALAQFAVNLLPVRQRFLKLTGLLACGYSLWFSSSSPNPSGSGQLNPARVARWIYSLTVLLDILQARAMARFDSRDSHFKRRISLILRTVNLSCVMTTSMLDWEIACHKSEINQREFPLHPYLKVIAMLRIE